MDFPWIAKQRFPVFQKTQSENYKYLCCYPSEIDPATPLKPYISVADTDGPKGSGYKVGRAISPYKALSVSDK